MDRKSATKIQPTLPLHQLISESQPVAVARQLELLQHAFYQSNEIDDDLPLSPTDQYCALMSVWEYAQQRQPGETLIRVFNPDPAKCGWHIEHTLVEIIMEDMPFIIASVLADLARQNIRVHHQAYPVFLIDRDKKGALKTLHTSGPGVNGTPEALLRLEIDRQISPEQRSAVAESLRNVLNDVRASVEDWKPMLARLEEAAEWCSSHAASYQTPELDETVRFLRWLGQENFLLIGSRFYDVSLKPDNTYHLNYLDGSGLGCFRDPISDSQREIRLDEYMSRLIEQPDMLVLTKSTTRSTVQQYAHLDYVGVKKINDQGRIIGEWRFFGLYSSKAHDAPLSTIPLISQRVQRVLADSGLPSDNHGYKVLRHLLNTYPRDEILQASYEQFRDAIFGMQRSFERRQLGLFLRPDTYGRFIDVLMLVPRDRYNTNLRLRVLDILKEEFDAYSVEFGVRLSEQPLALIEFTIHCRKAHLINPDVKKLKQKINDAMLSWQDKLHLAMLQELDEAESNRLLTRFGNAMSTAYQEEISASEAVRDICILDKMSAPLTTQLFPRSSDNDTIRFKVLGQGQSIALSDVLPILEHLGVRVLSASPYDVDLEDGRAFWIIDFSLDSADNPDLSSVQMRQQFQESFIRTYVGELENDRFHQLILKAGISYREVELMRALCKYLLQLSLPFSQHYIEQALSRNPQLCRQLISLFSARFDPMLKGDRDELQAIITSEINDALEAVDNLDEDRILRHYLELIQAMLRTSYYQSAEQTLDRLSFKFNTRAITAAPEPRPAFEIFVYSPRVEGVHLRAGPVARGGLRWSDRREDFRTEVLGLVKAQMVKNAVIVPVGAKGGFVPKQLPDSSDRNAVQAEVVSCYKTFIRGLLDLTDNLKDNQPVAPKNVVCHDEPDPYLVVAADKGTATFSDIANGISREYDFWLDDAFASGGSNGYDHKQMGITARGAWESVKRLFREQNRNSQREDFTVIGIGDMAGDVFGNGMLLSPHIRLLAAFNHMHIFIDPNPDAASSFKERQRLFKLPRSSWEDYDANLISKGGGIYRRSAKFIELSDQAREALGISDRRLAPTDLIRQLLQAPVDLLWNGGIGTYAKASTETHADVGDRANDGLRVDGAELRVKVVGEGGNLGLTQKARIEFARKGGLINTDAIDNAGGVDSSDHEVNLKILLSQEVASGRLSEADRNKLLASMTDEIATLVLKHNFQQSQILSLCAWQAPQRLNDHRRLIHMLERAGRLNRKLEHLPNEEHLEELARSNSGLSRPEIAVLMAYSKLWLSDQLIAEGVGEDQDLAQLLPDYFPVVIRNLYPQQIQQHPLRAELMATHLTNLVCNRMGSTFVSYLQSESNCTALNAVRAFIALSQIFNLNSLWQELEALEETVDDQLFRSQLTRIQDLVERSALWLVRHNPGNLSIAQLVERYHQLQTELPTALPELMHESGRNVIAEAIAELVAADVPEPLALRLASLPHLYAGLDIVELAQEQNQSSEDTARLYFALEQELHLQPLRSYISDLPEEDLWQRKARAALAFEVDRGQLQACTSILQDTDADLPLTERLSLWQSQHDKELRILQQTFTEVSSHDRPDLAMLSIVVRKLGSIHQLHLA